MTENKFELQSYFILYLLFVRMFQKTAKMIRTTPNKPYRTKRELSTPKSRSTQVEHTKAIVSKNVNTSYTVHIVDLLFGFPNFWRLALLTRNYFPKWPSKTSNWYRLVFFVHANVIVV
jgi:hypothetical protein